MNEEGNKIQHKSFQFTYSLAYDVVIQRTDLLNLIHPFENQIFVLPIL